MEFSHFRFHIESNHNVSCNRNSAISVSDQFHQKCCHISRSSAILTFMSNSQKMSCLTENQPFHFRVKSNHNDRHVNEISDNSVFHVKSNHNRFLCQIRPRFHVNRNLAISVSCQFRQKRCHV